MHRKFILLASAGIIFTFSQAIANDDRKGQTTKDEHKKFIDPAHIDTTVRPGDNFYLYANGTWMKNNPIPAKETRWGSFNELRDFNANAVRNILEEVSKDVNAPKGSIKQRVGDFYASGMDSLAIQKLGFSVIQADLSRVSKLKSLNDVLNELAVQRINGMGSPLYSFYIGQDRKNVTRMVPQLAQGGTTLPDRDYYLKDDNRSKTIRDAYLKYITQLYTLIGEDENQAAQHSKTILRMETSLAAAQMSRVEMRDPHKTYHKYAVAELNQLTPAINWQEQLSKMKVNGQDTVLVNSPDFFKEASDQLAKNSVDDWKVYLSWNILKNAAPVLSTPFVEANFSFTQVLSGQKVITPRWQRVFNTVDSQIGDLLGQLYIEKHFKPEAKARMQELVSNLASTFETRIKVLDWMSSETKVKALQKLHQFTKKIGYPDKWKTYDGLSISRDNFFQNIRQANTWEYNDMIGRLGKPVDKTRWGMTPPTVNAYYSPVNNEIAFPAGILQFPFFDFDADDAVNYGGIGAVIGHEMTHGFDDSGRQYAADGNLNDWWNKEDADNFKAKAAAVVEQYNSYKVLDSIHVNGKLTLGENLADLGGLNIAYEAFKKTRQGRSNEMIDGLTPDQRFFLSWAQVWRMNIRPETAAQLIIVDPHSPAEARTNGPLVNMDSWYKAFNVQPTDKLFKPASERIKVW
jgi:putative endopeptidase